jgi:hypothetical protein
MKILGIPRIPSTNVIHHRQVLFPANTTCEITCFPIALVMPNRYLLTRLASPSLPPPDSIHSSHPNHDPKISHGSDRDESSTNSFLATRKFPLQT